MLSGKKILLGVTGSIAAYKSILLLRLLQKEGAEVRVVLTPSATDFVTPLSLSTLSNHPALHSLTEGDSWTNHVALGRWADLMLIAPLSCNTLSKMANGACDNLLLATYLSATCPVWFAPAMDEDMWKHPSTQLNLLKVQSYGNILIPVENGPLASGLIGEGRMAEPEIILKKVQEHFFFKQDLKGRKALVTAGPTHEAIDPVRFIANHSSGKMGVAIARELAFRGAAVELVIGPTALEVKDPGIQVQQVISAAEMYEASVRIFPQVDIAVMAAAVADYTAAHVSKEKIKKKSEEFALDLVRTKDILGQLGLLKRENQVLAGFALENHNEKEYAIEKLKKKKADLIVLNSMNDAGAGFGVDSNKITIFEKSGIEYTYEQKPKELVAKDIVDRIVTLLYA